MKNLFLLPTDKPTRIFTVESEVRLAGYPTTIFKTGKSIYIINNDRIKESDWYIDLSNGKIIKADEFSEHKNYGYLCKKIILTTDVILRKYGIQAIDDDFLEWLVENPSCEEVEVHKFYKANPKYKEGSRLAEKVGYWEYKIIISKETSEETKQKVRDYGNNLVKQDRTCTHNCSVVCGECQIFK